MKVLKVSIRRGQFTNSMLIETMLIYNCGERSQWYSHLPIQATCSTINLHIQQLSSCLGTQIHLIDMECTCGDEYC